MARPKSKKELLIQSEKNYQKLLILIDSYTESERNRTFPEGYLNRNIRDVLAHLHHWHLMMKDWYEVGMGGTKPDMPAKGYSWKMTSELNKEIWKKYNTEDLSKIKHLLNNSYLELRKLIENHTEKELFEKKRYNWTGSTSLASYLISTTSSHYDWAYKLIKKCIKPIQKN
ncbi:MAG: ClbS/DfsB family four-helix bundle protein [Balneolaceae bacterium]